MQVFLSVDLVLWAETLRDSNFETDQMLVFALGKDKGPALSRLSADQFFLFFFVSTCF